MLGPPSDGSANGRIGGPRFPSLTTEWRARTLQTLPCRQTSGLRSAVSSLGRRTAELIRAGTRPFRACTWSHTDVAPYFLWPRGNEKDEAYLLGVLSCLCRSTGTPDVS